MSEAEHTVKRFAVDIMLGRLVKWLRILGFDARFISLQDRPLIDSLLSEGLIPVTRKEKFRNIEEVLFIHSDHHIEQLKELISSLRINVEEFRLFSRCSICNEELLKIPKGTAFGAVPDYVFETSSDFRQCPQCSKVYWPGGHRRRMMEELRNLGIWGLRSPSEDLPT